MLHDAHAKKGEIGYSSDRYHRRRATIGRCLFSCIPASSRELEQMHAAVTEIYAEKVFGPRKRF